MALRRNARTPRRGGRLSRPHGERQQANISSHALVVLIAGFLVLGVVAGFAWQLDRQLSAGLLQQRAEAMQRDDWVPLETLPEVVVSVFVNVVDPGFDAGRTLRRPRDEEQAIPRHLVRHIHLLGTGMGSRARELVMAPVLEQRLSKQQQLELYLNRVYLGRLQDFPIHGLHHGALEYFSKVPQELTLSEAATLAGLLLKPMIERPEERPGAVGARRNEVLRALLDRGEIEPEHFAQAIAERLAFQPGLREFPMSRRLRADTAVIRLPPQYRPQLEDPDEEPD
jgi:hypothetical protein